MAQGAGKDNNGDGPDAGLDAARALQFLEEANRQRRAFGGLLSEILDSNQPITREKGPLASLLRRDRAPRVDLQALAAELLAEPVAAQQAPLRLAAPPVVLSIENVSKSFVIPDEKIDSLKARLMKHPFSGTTSRRLEVLHDISLNVRQGEFLGVVGTNGAGKSTLLKLIASTYRPDSGRIRMAGRIAPLIELGVGFHPELTAHDNVIMSASMLGLTPERARERWPAIMEFSGLEDFAELKLRNYSSGMRVRLAFAVAMEVEADILLMDEVLAVGDGPFQERCGEALQELHQAGKTILFVSHSMDLVKASCDRAVLISEGRVVADGRPDLVADRYEEIMSERERESRPDSMPKLEAVESGP